MYAQLARSAQTFVASPKGYNMLLNRTLPANNHGLPPLEAAWQEMPRRYLLASIPSISATAQAQQSARLPLPLSAAVCCRCVATATPDCVPPWSASPIAS